MAVDISWLVDKRVILMRFHGVVTMNDMEKQKNVVAEMAHNGIQPIHILSDSTDVVRSEIGISDLRGLVGTTVTEGWTFLITSNPMHRFLGSVALQLGSGRYKMVATMADAKKHLLERDASLTEYFA